MTDEETIKEIQKLKKEGKRISFIARTLGLSRPTTKKYLREQNLEAVHERRPFSIPQRKVIPVNLPSQRVRDRRDDAEIVSLEIERQKGLKELQKVVGSQISPELQKKKDDLEIKKINIEEFETDRKLKALTDEERRKIQAEEEDRFEREIERQRLAEEQERTKQHLKWVEEWKDRALTWWVPSGVSIPADVKFKIKDGVGKVLMDRSEHESKWDIEELVKITTQSVLQPFLDKVKAEKKTRLIQLWALPKIEDYITEHRLQAYVDEEGKDKVREHIRGHFMKTLTGNEAVIFSHEVTNLLDGFLKPIKEKVREMKERERQERERKEREEKEAKEKAFQEKMKEERKKEEMEELLRVGMNRFNWYLTIHRKELEPLKYEEREEAKRHLERELKEEIEGNETDREIEKTADRVLDDFFFEE